MLYVGVVLAAFCCALGVIGVVWQQQQQTLAGEPAVEQIAEPEPMPVAEPEPERVREEDLVRPAVDADGNPTWVTVDEVVWHEIVHWPTPKVPETPRRTRRWHAGG